jgi:nucleoside-diphosphate-sugar epimerase
MRIFVTGGTGFLGRHLLPALGGAGHEVVALVRSEAAALVAEQGGARPVRGGLADAAALRTGMSGCDTVVHAAAHTAPWGPRRDFELVNIEGTEAVLRAAREAGVSRLVHVSSEAVLADGRPLVRVDETHPLPAHPVGSYPDTKAIAERLVRAANGPGLSTVVVRPRLVWGPGDTTVLPVLLAIARSGRFVWVDGGRYLTSTCHVANACAGLLLAIEKGAAGGVYFVSDGDPCELRWFLTALADTAGVRLGDRSLPRWALWAAAVAAERAWPLLRRPGAPPLTRTFLALSGQEMTVDDGRARRELGYRPVLTREAGLAQLSRQTAEAGPG